MRGGFLLGSLCFGLVGLALAVGNRLPDDLMAFSARCGDDEEIYISDWPHALTIDVSNSSGSRDRMPAWSPDGQQIAFVMERVGNQDIYIADLTSGSIRSLVQNATRDTLPTWSPDGQQIAFYSADEADRLSISILDMVAGTIREFPAVSIPRDPPVWSPDSEHLAFADWNDHWEVFTLDITTGEVRNISNYLEASDSRPAWSPNGRYITFGSLRQGDGQVYIADVDTGKVTDLSNNVEATYGATAWSPDGQQIATPVGGTEVRILDITGRVVRTFDLRPKWGALKAIDWSPEGSYLVVGIYDSSGYYLIDSISGALATLSNPACVYESAVWAPQ